MAHYIVCMKAKTLFLVGPFVSHDAAGAWGYDHNKSDVPTWQTIDLSTTHMIPVYRPLRIVDMGEYTATSPVLTEAA